MLFKASIYSKVPGKLSRIKKLQQEWLELPNGSPEKEEKLAELKNEATTYGDYNAIYKSTPDNTPEKQVALEMLEQRIEQIKFGSKAIKEYFSFLNEAQTRPSRDRIK